MKKILFIFFRFAKKFKEFKPVFLSENSFRSSFFFSGCRSFKKAFCIQNFFLYPVPELFCRSRNLFHFQLGQFSQIPHLFKINGKNKLGKNQATSLQSPDCKFDFVFFSRASFDWSNNKNLFSPFCRDSTNPKKNSKRHQGVY